MPRWAQTTGFLLLSVWALALGPGCFTPDLTVEARGSQLFTSPQHDAVALSPDGSRLFVANTAAGTVDVIDTTTNTKTRSIEVGVDPVAVAVRPDGNQVWVANHVSDSVNVIDAQVGSPTRWTVIETIQSVDPATLVTQFDEPAGIAFASNNKAYVSLSSRNRIAVVDATTYEVTGFLQLNAQEPRSMRVRNGLLYVPAFESGNQSELSTCPSPPFVIDGNQCTFDLGDVNFAQEPNLTSVPVDIVADPDVPDRDLFVFDTTTDALVDVVDGVGTLLYGVAVDSAGRAFITQADARNTANGRAGTQGHTLATLTNRLFLNRVAKVSCSAGGCGPATNIELEPLPPVNPAAGQQLATPFGIAVSNDDTTLVGSAAASNRVFTLDAATGAVLDVIDVGNIPRGVALRSDPGTGAAKTAYVLNALDNTVSVIDVANPAALVETARIAIALDPTPPNILAGRIGFESAAASTTGTFSCASCHPDGNTDQLLWVIGAQCTFAGCDQEEPRSTMPVRGLRDTLPLHWDGALGDPIGLRNGEVGVNVFIPANCTTDQSCFRHLVNASEAGVMCDQASCPTNQNELGLLGQLTEQQRENIATFLQNVSYPPARSRRPDDSLSASAVAGFDDFFLNQGGINPPGPGGAGPETCADAAGGCHALPHGASSNSQFVGGFEAPTMRGITDRFTLFSAGVTNVQENLLLAPSDAPWSPAVGFDELTVWSLAFGTAASPQAFRNVYNVGGADIFQMIEEMSTGHSGALGRQVELNTRTTSPSKLAATDAQLAALEAADLGGSVNLRAKGPVDGSERLLHLQPNGRYEQSGFSFSRADLIAKAQASQANLMVSALHRSGVNAATEQPAIWVPSVGNVFFDGRLLLPVLPSATPMGLFAKRVTANPIVLIDGNPTPATVTCVSGTFSPTCTGLGIQITLSAPPTAVGTHLLQIQNQNGLLSNELPVLRQ